MNFVVKKISLAELDAADAAVWYESQLAGLGGDFLDEVEAAFSSLEHDALQYAVRFSEVRCMRLRRFTGYGVYYVIQRDEVWILAVLHGARDVETILRGRI